MTRILGVDFSGAKDAGQKIWLASGRRIKNGEFELESCTPAIDLPGGGARATEAILALAQQIVALPDTVVGCDFPFGLPKQLVEAATWRDFALAFPQLFPDHESFRLLTRERTEKIEHKRQTDRIAKTPFNSYNLRLYRQTWWGIAALLRRLVARNLIVVRPQQPLKSGRPVVVEVCAACTLKHIDCYPAYKGKLPIHRRARKQILDALFDQELLTPPSRSTRTLLLDNTGGDALDAVIGAIAAGQADLKRPADQFERLEGRVFYEVGGP